MNTFKVTSLFLLLSSLLSIAAEPRPYSAEWLKKGCIYITAYSNEATSLQPSQRDTCIAVGAWLSGNLSGFISGLSLVPGAKKKIPDGWLDPVRSAPQIVAFMDKNRDLIHPNSDAVGVTWAWALTVYPDVTEEQRKLATEVLKRYSGEAQR